MKSTWKQGSMCLLAALSFFWVTANASDLAPTSSESPKTIQKPATIPQDTPFIKFKSQYAEIKSRLRIQKNRCEQVRSQFMFLPSEENRTKMVSIVKKVHFISIDFKSIRIERKLCSDLRRVEEKVLKTMEKFLKRLTNQILRPIKFWEGPIAMSRISFGEKDENASESGDPKQVEAVSNASLRYEQLEAQCEQMKKSVKGLKAAVADLQEKVGKDEMDSKEQDKCHRLTSDIKKTKKEIKKGNKKAKAAHDLTSQEQTKLQAKSDKYIAILKSLSKQLNTLNQQEGKHNEKSSQSTSGSTANTPTVVPTPPSSIIPVVPINSSNSTLPQPANITATPTNIAATPTSITATPTNDSHLPPGSSPPSSSTIPSILAPSVFPAAPPINAPPSIPLPPSSTPPSKAVSSWQSQFSPLPQSVTLMPITSNVLPTVSQTASIPAVPLPTNHIIGPTPGSMASMPVLPSIAPITTPSASTTVYQNSLSSENQLSAFPEISPLGANQNQLNQRASIGVIPLS